MQATLEKAVGAASFSMPRMMAGLAEKIAAEQPLASHLEKIAASLPPQHCQRVLWAVFRASFLIELVKLPKVETTKMRVRWCDQLEGDPRYAAYGECRAIAEGLLAMLADDWLQHPENRDLLLQFLAQAVLPYEVPLDYSPACAQASTQTGTPIHGPGHLEWFSAPVYSRAMKLRGYLRDPAVTNKAPFFRRVISDKVRVKTYLTDRALTGEHKTNREKRWEVHPQSVQFATRRQCLEVEDKLLRQLCGFEGFPQALLDSMIEEGVLSEAPEACRCPVTLNSLHFDLLEQEIKDPQHGKAAFQVGHLNPLKAPAPQNAEWGHSAENVAWISSDGNRIQGSLSLADTKELLMQIGQNYTNAGGH